MSGLRSVFTLGGECQPSGRTSPPNPRRSSTENDDLSWAEVDKGDDASAPNVAGHFGRPRGGVQLELPRGENLFTLGGGVTFQAPPAGIPPQWEELREASPPHQQAGIQGTGEPPAQQTAPMALYSGMAAAIKKWGIGDTVMQNAEGNYRGHQTSPGKTHRIHWGPHGVA